MINAVKEKIVINKLITRKKENICVEGDVIVPDSKPDILNTICTSGIVSIYKKEVLEEKLRLDGNINTYIMYLSEDGKDKVRSINTYLDFSEIIHIEEVKSGMEVSITCKVKNTDCRVINGRKISIKSNVEIDLSIYSKEEVEIVNEIDGSKDIQMLKEELEINSLVGTGETKISAKDTLMIDNVDNLAEILKADLSIINKDIKISYNKLLTKAEAEIKLMYLTEDNRIRQYISTIPIVGFIDILNVAEGHICDINYEIRNCILKPNQSEEHSIYLEVEIEVTASVFENKKINLIQDLYSPCKKLEFNRKHIRTVMGKMNLKDMISIREKIILESLGNKEILDVDIKGIIESEVKKDNKIMYDGVIELKFMLLDEKGMIDIKLSSIPFNHVVSDNVDMANINSMLEMEISNSNFVIQEGEVVSCNIDLSLNISIFEFGNINIMEKIEINGDRDVDEYNIVIYVVKKEDTLWNIAKKFGSTMEDIAVINGINKGDKLFYRSKDFYS